VEKLHNEELRDLYNSIIRIIKSRRMRWAGHIARMGEKKNTYRLVVGPFSERWKQIQFPKRCFAVNQNNGW
jgi:hypothetical protein